jgi:Flp pilus assembly protein TadB
MINSVQMFLSKNISNIYFLSLQYKLISFSLFIVLVLIISSFSFNGKITLKRNKRIWHLKSSKVFVKYIEKSKYLKEKRDTLARDIAFISQKNSNSNKIIANTIIYVFTIFMIIVTVVSVIFLNYFILKLVVPIILMIMILFMFSFELNRRRKKARKDFGKVVKIFTTKYAKSFNTLLAFQESIEDIPSSHIYEFNRLISSMGSATDYIEALNEYAARINDLMCYLFIEILKIGFKRNEYVLYALIDLENDIAVEKKAEKIKNNKLGDKKMNIYLGIFAIFGSFIITITFIGDYAKNLYFSTFGGQVFILAGIIIVSGILICISILNKLL